MATTRIELVTHLSIIVLALTVSAVLAQKHFRSRPPGTPATLAAGQQVELPAELAQGEGRLLLLALQPECGYCTRSLEFYRELDQRRRQATTALRLVALVGREEDLESEAQILAQAGVETDQLVLADLSAMGIPGTPFLVLAEPDGRVRRVWPGELGADQRQAVLNELGLS